MKALILSADNFEDSELLVPLYRLQEAGYTVEIAAPGRGPLRGKHGYEVTAERSLAEVVPDDYALLVLPGGKAPAAIRTDLPIVLDLEKARPGKSCFAHQSHNCKGVCIGREPLGIHSARLMAALAKLKLKEWNYPGPIALVEKDDFSGTDLHLVDRWCYLGTAQSEAGLWELLDSAPTRPVFDADIYRQLNKAITQGKVEVLPLGQRPA